MPTRSTILLIGLLCAGVAPLAAAPLATDLGEPPSDSVTLLLENGGRIVHKCRVLDYNGREIRILPESGREIAYPASRVLGVETPWTAPHRQGRELFARGRFADAAEAFEQAIAAERNEPHRQWVRREILAELVRCALATGDRVVARQRFELLVSSDRHTRHFGLIPLEWGTAATPDRDTADARLLLGKDLDAARLMGASVLLFDPKHEATAEVEIRRLLASSDPNVAALAAAQRWRLRAGEASLRADHLDEWRRRIEAMPAELRGGPYYVLGRACFARREYDRAATFLLWLPLVSPSDAHPAARAAFEAAEALTQIGQKAEARRICHDILDRFAHTPFAQDAQGLIDSQRTEGQDAP